jgi:TonB family protein
MPPLRQRTFAFSNREPAALVAAPPAEPPQVKFVVEVDARAQPPYPYRVRMAATLLHSVEPVYPAQAKAAGIQGDVKLNVVIGMDGRIINVEAIAGYPLLAAAAIDAVRQYIYQPRILGNGERVEIQTTVTIPFRLEGGAAVTQDGGQAPEPQPSQQSPGNSPPRLIYKVEPEYPMEAREAQRQGTVTIAITIGADGVPKDGGRLMNSPGFNLEQPALNAVRQWKFKPALQDGQPVDSTAIVEVRFRLY